MAADERDDRSYAENVLCIPYEEFRRMQSTTAESQMRDTIARLTRERDEADRKLVAMGGAVLTVIGDKVQPRAKVVDPEAVADAVSNRLADVERERDEEREKLARVAELVTGMCDDDSVSSRDIVLAIDGEEPAKDGAR